MDVDILTWLDYWRDRIPETAAASLQGIVVWQPTFETIDVIRNGERVEILGRTVERMRGVPTGDLQQPRRLSALSSLPVIVYATCHACHESFIDDLPRETSYYCPNGCGAILWPRHAEAARYEVTSGDGSERGKSMSDF